jgi:class 3 adenylate cyclase
MSAMDERRLVSVLFADLVGFTSRSHGADPAEIRALQRPFHARVKHEVERRGGRVEKFIGDAVVAVFGADDGDRNDAERAVRVALRIPEIVEELNEEQPGLDLAVRVGVNSDTVAVDEAEDLAVGAVTGDVVNVAGKIQGVAPPGGVAVCQTTYERTCARFRYSSLEPVSLPGRVERAPVWQPAPRRRRGGGWTGEVDEGPAPGDEVREVTVLFADLLDFSLRSHSADPEEMRALLRPYFAAIRREVDRYGGTVERFLGDAIMAVFGAPVARADDAERAVRAALRIPQAVVELNEDDAFREVAVRAAVNTGQVAVALGAQIEAGESMVTGDAVNTAARLMAAAPVGTVVVGEGTYEQTKDAVDYEALPPIEAKGKPEPVPLFQALGARDRERLDTTEREPDFVGRGPELALLKGAFARVLLERTPQVVVLTGPAGIGKTRIVGELRVSTGERTEIVEWRRGQSLPYGGIAFSALGDLVKNAAAILKSDGVVEAEPKLAALVRSLTTDAAERAALFAALAPLAGIAPEDEPDPAAWGRFLTLTAAQRPLVCLLEDLQWADSTTLDFVEHLADHARGQLLVVATTREAGDWARGRENVTHVDVGPLGDGDVVRLLESLDAMVDAELAQGNPLHAVELARLGRDLEGSLEDVVRARLARLSPEQRRALEAGAVVGRTFWGGAVAALAPCEVQDACSRLDEATGAELLRGVRISTVAREAEYAFVHPLVREVAYAEADPALHLAAAEWLDRALGGRADHDVLVEYHRAAAVR